MRTLGTLVAVVTLLVVAAFTVSASPSEAEAHEAWTLVNLAYAQTAMNAAAGNVDGVTMSMGAEGFTYTFDEFDLSNLDIDPSVEMLMLGNSYTTVSGALTVDNAGSMSAEYRLTGGPVSELTYEFDGVTVEMVADGAAYTY